MDRPAKLPVWLKLTLVLFVVGFATRYVAAIESGASHTVAIRTYAFWALVCVPVACLADMIGREILNYRLVRVAVARVKSSRRAR